MQPEHLEALAGEVARVIKATVAPLLARLEALEARPPLVGPPGIQGLTGAAGEPGAKGLDGAPGRDGRDGAAGTPGEKGVAGADGRHGTDGLAGTDGVNGLDGKDGAAGLAFMGVYQEGKAYDVGHLVTWAGSSWHCNEGTTTKPGDGKAWTLMVKRGRDGRDGLDAPGALPVVKVR